MAAFLTLGCIAAGETYTSPGFRANALAILFGSVVGLSRRTGGTADVLAG